MEQEGRVGVWMSRQGGTRREGSGMDVNAGWNKKGG